MKKDKVSQHSKALKRILAVLTIVIALGGYFVGGLNVSARTRAEAIVANGYYKQGYDPAVANDQAAEDFGRDGECATGGIDGRLLDGTVAKDNVLVPYVVKHIPKRVSMDNMSMRNRQKV